MLARRLSRKWAADGGAALWARAAAALWARARRAARVETWVARAEAGAAAARRSLAAYRRPRALLAHENVQVPVGETDRGRRRDFYTPPPTL
jgi:hypothetical protein